MRIKGQLMWTRRRPHQFRVYLVWRTCLIIGSNLLHRYRHIFRDSLFWNHLLFVHCLVLLEVTGCDSRVYFLDLHYILFHFLEVRVFELSVLVKIRALLTISKHECRDFFQVEVFVACERKYFIVV